MNAIRPVQILLPESTTPARIEGNFKLFDFEGEPADVEAIGAIGAIGGGEAARIGANPDAFAYIPPRPRLATGC